MTNSDEAAKAIAQLNDSELKGGNLKVNVAKPRESRVDTNNRGGGGGAMAAANTDPIQKPPGPFFSSEAILRLPQGKPKGHYIGERREGTGAVRMAESRAARIRPAAHNLEVYLTAYIEGTGLVYDPKGSLFRTLGRETKQLTRTLRRAANAGIAAKIGTEFSRRNYCLPEERRDAGKSRIDGQSCQHADDAAL